MRFEHLERAVLRPRYDDVAVDRLAAANLSLDLFPGHLARDVALVGIIADVFPPLPQIKV